MAYHKEIYPRHKDAVNASLKLIHGKEIAIVGVSSREHKYGYRIFKDLIKHGFQVHGVNPRGGQVLGRKILRNLRELERIPDIVITVVPAGVALGIIEDCRSLGVKEIWMQPGSESPEALAKARSYGIKATANACFMQEIGIW